MTAQKPPASPLKNKTLSIFRNAFASVVWLYAVTKLFVFDLDLWLVGLMLPGSPEVVRYRFVFILSVTVLLLLALGVRRFLWWILYTLFFPLILFTWLLPKRLYKTNNVFWIFTYANALLNSLRPFRGRLISLLFICLSFVLVVNSSNQYLLIIGCCLAALVLAIRLTTQTRRAFKPTRFLAVDVDVMVKFVKSDAFNKGISKFFDDISKQPNNATNSSASKSRVEATPLVTNKKSRKLGRQRSAAASGSRALKIQNMIIYNRVALLLATNIKKYRESKVYVMFIILDFVATLLIAMVCFALVNFGVYKLDAGNFNVTIEPGLFDFFYYSFHTVVVSQIPEIQPASLLTRLLSIFEIFLVGIYFLVFAVSTVASVLQARYDRDLTTLVEMLKEQGAQVEEQLRKDYSVRNIDAGVELLRELQTTSTKLIIWFTDRIDL